MPEKLFSHPARRWALCLLLLASLSLACASQPAASPTSTLQEAAPPTAVPAQPTPVIPTATAVPPEPTPLPPEPTSVPAEPPVEGGQFVLIYLIALGDNGISGPLVGCGDSAVPVTLEIPPTEGILRAALDHLLAQKDQYYGQSGLYNALYQSDLVVQDVTIVDGEARIYLTGALMQGGECDSPRIQAQLEQTAFQFSTVQAVTIFINDVPLADALSLQGP